MRAATFSLKEAFHTGLAQTPQVIASLFLWPPFMAVQLCVRAEFVRASARGNGRGMFNECDILS